jgi:hypothetical protein
MFDGATTGGVVSGNLGSIANMQLVYLYGGSRATITGNTLLPPGTPLPPTTASGPTTTATHTPQPATPASLSSPAPAAAHTAATGARTRNGTYVAHSGRGGATIVELRNGHVTTVRVTLRLNCRVHGRHSTAIRSFSSTKPRGAHTARRRARLVLSWRVGALNHAGLVTVILDLRSRLTFTDSVRMRTPTGSCSGTWRGLLRAGS